MKATLNVSLLLQDVMDLVTEGTAGEWVDSYYVLVNGSSSTSNQTDGDGRTAGSLLMPIWAYQSAAAYLVFIGFVGVFMNILIVVVILNDPLKMTALNWMLLNLACSDGIIAGFGAPISASAALHLDWPFSDELCIAYAMIMSTAGIGSITTLAVLALWRCQLVVYCPAKRGSAFASSNGGRLGPCRAVLLLAIIWTYSLAVTCPPLFGWGRYDREAAHISCSVNWESRMDNNRLYILYMFAFGLFVPLAIIVVSYVSILRIIKKTKEMRRKTQAAVTGYYQHQSQPVITATTTPHSCPIGSQQSQRVRINIQKTSSTDAAEKRVTVMVACMVGAFMTAWTPYSILALFETFTSDVGIPFNSNSSSQGNEFHYAGTISPALATIPSLFAKTSAVFNPLIYGLLNTQFRVAWQKCSLRFLGRRLRRSEMAEVNSGCKRRKNWRQLFDRAASPTLKPSATVRLSMKQIHFDESRSIYIMANPRPLIASPTVGRLAHHVLEHQRPPSPTRMSLSMDDESTIVHQQPIQMKLFKNSELQKPVHQQEDGLI